MTEKRREEIILIELIKVSVRLKYVKQFNQNEIIFHPFTEI